MALIVVLATDKIIDGLGSGPFANKSDQFSAGQVSKLTQLAIKEGYAVTVGEGNGVSGVI